MATIKWDESNSVGNKQIDDQHKMWVDIVNKLEQQLTSSDRQGSSYFQPLLLEELVDFTKKHFETEEKLMEQHHYPNLSAHRRMHKDFHQKIYDLYRQVLAGEVILNTEIIGMISSWFISHTSTEDKKAFLYINPVNHYSDPKL